MSTPEDKLKIFVWADGSWESEEEIDDMDWYISSNGKSDDFTEYLIPIELDPEEIDELIELEALPGMLPDMPQEIQETQEIQGIIGGGKLAIPEGSVLIVHHSKDIDYNAVTMLEDKLIVNAPDVFVEIIQSKEDKDENRN